MKTTEEEIHEIETRWYRGDPISLIVDELKKDRSTIRWHIMKRHMTQSPEAMKRMMELSTKMKEERRLKYNYKVFRSALIVKTYQQYLQETVKRNSTRDPMRRCTDCKLERERFAFSFDPSGVTCYDCYLDRVTRVKSLIP